MPNIRIIFSSMILLCVSSCVSTREVVPKPYSGMTQPFGESDVVGWRYDLVSESNVFSIRFLKGGYAPAYIGTKAALAAPGYHWEIDETRCLTISNDDAAIASYQLISRAGNTVTVWDKIGGKMKVFERER